MSVGLAFSVIQITNLLLPGLVIHKLKADSSLFGLLEMAAAITGMAVLAIAGLPSVARKTVLNAGNRSTPLAFGNGWPQEYQHAKHTG
ncbi:hypothetical protein [Burkholderia stagnalis]|uniref:hypothetical protein n=1 Tax=Burkholderia stagnalis TaxID=1503054 RepID=UPI0012D89329|nr:hypothetical protein [Burkholderia stagnalis]